MTEHLAKPTPQPSPNVAMVRLHHNSFMKGKPMKAVYYVLIGISTLSLVAGIILIVYGGLGLVSTPAAFTGTNPKYIIEIIIGTILLMIYPALSRLRQKYRDLVEYDEFGNSISHGSFSRLSKKERDALDRQQMAENERLLPTAQLKTMTHSVKKMDPLAELNSMIGVDNVKQEVLRMKSRMEFDGAKSLSSMSQIYYGRPGTGKTTVARIMAGLLYQYKYIKKPQIIEVDGNFFNCTTRTEASQKARLLIQKARGGVLFIDEAYALLTGGQEVIATLVAAIENYKDDTVFIFAGYEAEMKQFVDSNPGIESRIKYHLYFHDYTKKELKQIFLNMAHASGFSVSQELLDAVGNKMDKMRNDPHFGNARSIRTELDLIINEHAVNYQNGISERERLTLIDFA